MNPKRILPGLFLVPLFILLTSAAPWRTDFERAQKDATAQHKLILLKFSGSDWCVPCIRMEKELFSQDAFQPFADSALILVNADFPQQLKHQPDAKTKAANDALAARYNKTGIFPMTVLIKADGTVLKHWNGYTKMTVPDFIRDIQAATPATY
jgi:thioredoxin-related protein